MKKIKYTTNKVLSIFCMIILLFTASCNEDILNEVPLDFLSPENTFTDAVGFEAGLTVLYQNVRGYIGYNNSGLNEKVWEVIYGQGADIGWHHFAPGNYLGDYTKVNSSNAHANEFWKLGYGIIKNANVIISRAELENVEWASEQEKNEIVAQARFFRAYAYRELVWFFGGVPIIREEITAPKLDFVRDSNDDVIAFILEDLEFASQNLTADNPKGARLSKAAADYLLAETYNATQQWDKAMQAADRILNDSKYDLMRERFGSIAGQPGDPYFDLFRYGNQDRSSGNKENIFALQFEYDVDGGGQNRVERAWGPFAERQKTPDNMQAILKNEFWGRPVGFINPTDFTSYGMWDDFDNDMRNSEYNCTREFIINNPASAHYGEVLVPTEPKWLWPYYQKFTHVVAHPQGYDTGGIIHNDWYVFRVAGVYLLKAEAYLGKGDNTNAAAAINVLRTRAHASLVAPGDVDIDYILDERARELLGEEHRRVTLSRTGKLLERTQLYNPHTGPTMQAHNVLLPIPQSQIDANTEAVLEQNPGY